MTTVTGTNANTISHQAKEENVLDFLESLTKDNGVKQFTCSKYENGQGQGQDECAELLYAVASTDLGSGTFQYNIFVTAKGDYNPDQGGVEWDLPYYYRIETTGTSKGVSQEIVLSGDFTVHIQKDNFAKYALFTDHHTMKDGKSVWFTSKTNFAGPVHTNDKLSFAFNPSGTFDGLVTQQNTKAQFYDGGHVKLLDADYYSNIDVPIFNEGFLRGQSQIVLSSSIQKDDVKNQATGGQSINTDGIYVPNDGQTTVGGIYIRGSATIAMGVDASDRATYTIKQSTATKTIVVDRTAQKTIISQTGKSDIIYSGLPNGIDDVGTILYVDGKVSGLAGTVQRDSEVTVSAESEIEITNHIQYADYTPAVGTPGAAGYVPPNANNAKNLLGILSWGGDVLIGSSAPKDINIHGIVLARNGVFQVYNYSGSKVRGTATLLGGAITQFYGAFGTFDVSGKMISGYGRNFVYDDRTLTGASPPYFPTLDTYTSFSNDIMDKIIWQEG